MNLVELITAVDNACENSEETYSYQWLVPAVTDAYQKESYTRLRLLTDRIKTKCCKDCYENFSRLN